MGCQKETGEYGGRGKEGERKVVVKTSGTKMQEPGKKS
jgi:hypothetical protein